MVVVASGSVFFLFFFFSEDLSIRPHSLSQPTSQPLVHTPHSYSHVEKRYNSRLQVLYSLSPLTVLVGRMSGPAAGHVHIKRGHSLTLVFLFLGLDLCWLERGVLKSYVPAAGMGGDVVLLRFCSFLFFLFFFCGLVVFLRLSTMWYICILTTFNDVLN